jgi:hypothetical protein
MVTYGAGIRNTPVRRSAMTINAGMTAPITGVYRCVRCGAAMSVQKGDRIHKCPNEHTEFEKPAGAVEQAAEDG